MASAARNRAGKGVDLSASLVVLCSASRENIFPCGFFLSSSLLSFFFLSPLLFLSLTSYLLPVPSACQVLMRGRRSGINGTGIRPGDVRRRLPEIAAAVFRGVQEDFYRVTPVRGIARWAGGRLFLAESAPEVMGLGDLVFAEAIAEYRKQVTR
jgi:hypothetical protein